MSPRGLLVHARKDWPCRVCRPSATEKPRAYCLCLDCATAILAEAEAGAEDARALLPDLTVALNFLGRGLDDEPSRFD